ncbi:MarR family winged helix-turn-helix transcriptional regulator [Sporomusa malonica]|uniref:DNA-binding transcriptional regulator, MarR family n=1 Tax=Sporomusa malonica TaxID=112901 RepID=A0A1W1Y7Z3_9FIRM|nr:MarR family transcriptional regulator [Sporomusa malonica]SMC32269.1 DNA-binding transcriptional regulator, MarR family [Sporomusa malonica]
MDRVKTAEMMFHLIPLLDKEFVRPVEQQFKVILSSIQIHVLVILREKKATMTALSQEMLMSKQQMTPIIDKLVSEGFAQREYDNLDRRIIRIGITSSGLNIVENVKEKAMLILEKKIEHLDDQDVLSLNNAISELQRIINKMA